MGAAKRLLESLEQKRQVAMRIALEAKVLRRCDYHDLVLDGGVDAEAAYRLGNFKFSNGLLGDVFDSRREMTDFIKAAVEEHWTDECGICAKNAAA